MVSIDERTGDGAVVQDVPAPAAGAALTAGEREIIAEVREELALARERLADKRDLVADSRELELDRRDQQLTEQGLPAADPGTPWSPQTQLEKLLRIAADKENTTDLQWRSLPDPAGEH